MRTIKIREPKVLGAGDLVDGGGKFCALGYILWESGEMTEAEYDSIKNKLEDHSKISSNNFVKFSDLIGTMELTAHIWENNDDASTEEERLEEFKSSIDKINEVSPTIRLEFDDSDEFRNPPKSQPEESRVDYQHVG